MARELAYVLINPYTIAKSRTGGVIARYLSRTDLDLVAARMVGPSSELVSQYAALVRSAEPGSTTCELISQYIAKNYSPDPITGKRRRVMMLMFEGDDAVRKIWQVTGSATLRLGSGESIRDTYGDYVLDEQNTVKYFEPAVLVGPTIKRVAATLKLWAKFSGRDGGIVEGASDVGKGGDVEKTLVLLKPDNFQFHSSRPGNIVDLLSLSGLRIVAVTKFRMTVSQAEEFYGPVRESLRGRFKTSGKKRAADALSREFGLEVPEDVVDSVCDRLGPVVASREFENIVEFMTGYRPSACSESEKRAPGREECLALVYMGTHAVRKIRSILGPTDPSKAKPGSVRREFGSNIMVNAAHASDSAENARREMEIIRVEEDTVSPLVDKFYGSGLSALSSLRFLAPSFGGEFVRKIREKLRAKHS
jgi:nucleoside diphosphate kinase